MFLRRVRYCCAINCAVAKLGLRTCLTYAGLRCGPIFLAYFCLKDQQRIHRTDSLRCCLMIWMLLQWSLCWNNDPHVARMIPMFLEWSQCCYVECASIAVGTLNSMLLGDHSVVLRSNNFCVFCKCWLRSVHFPLRCVLMVLAKVFKSASNKV